MRRQYGAVDPDNCLVAADTDLVQEDSAAGLVGVGVWHAGTHRALDFRSAPLGGVLTTSEAPLASMMQHIEINKLFACYLH